MLDDVIACLQEIREKFPHLDLCRHGRFELTIKDGVLFSVGPMPYLRRGIDFHVSSGVIDKRKTL